MTSTPRLEHLDLISELNLISCYPVCAERDRRAWQLVLRPELQAISKRVTRRWRSAAIASEDLGQSSLIGLKRAIDAWRCGCTWGEFLSAAESWIRHELQLLAGQHRTVHLTDDLMRCARRAQMFAIRGMGAEAIAGKMGLDAEEVAELLIVPLGAGRQELTAAIVNKKSFSDGSEDRIVAALDMKRSGKGLVDADNLGEQQPDLPVLAHVVADRQPVKVVKKRVFRAPVVGWRQLALVG